MRLKAPSTSCGQSPPERRARRDRHSRPSASLPPQTRGRRCRTSVLSTKPDSQPFIRSDSTLAMRAARALTTFLVSCLHIIAIIATMNLAACGKKDRPPVSLNAWNEQALVPGEIALDVPWPLEATEVPLPPEIAGLYTRYVMRSRRADGLSFAASVGSLVPGTEGMNNLDGGVDAALAKIRKQVGGTGSVFSKKTEMLIMGVRAIEFDAHFERAEPLRVRGLVFRWRDDVVQVLLISNSGNDAADQAWARMRNSIRKPRA